MRGATGPVILYYAVYHTFQSTLLMRGATSRSVLTHRACAKFQSTLLMRGATCHLRLFRRRADFNPRSSCEERRVHEKDDLLGDGISIHAPHARSDDDNPKVCDRHPISIHAPHARSDFIVDDCGKALNDISIHAPHARSDRSADRRVPTLAHISIHAPHARSDGRPVLYLSLMLIFQSTLLMRGATSYSRRMLSILVRFQSTLLMRGATDDRRGYPGL